MAATDTRQASLPRLLAGLSSGTLADLEYHYEVHGPLPTDRDLAGSQIVDLVEQAGLRGRGGAAFPTARKLRAVRSERGGAVVVANGCESEPLSAKDALLVRELPHLVLDGAALAARAVGADRVIVALKSSAAAERDALELALDQRRNARVDDVDFESFAAADSFLSGQEAALVSQLNGGPPLPTFIPPRVTERGVQKRPTLVQNVETLANIALIARHGAGWYRAIGTDAEAGATLVTLAGAVDVPGVYEVAYGTSLHDVLSAADVQWSEVAGFLVGGYFGSWLPVNLVGRLELSQRSLSDHGVSLGCGVVFALPASCCPVAETVRIAAYLAAQSARQCGPCINGTAAIADNLRSIEQGNATRVAFADLMRWTLELPGRGACHHPNGVARFVSTALRTFMAQFDDHARHGPCDACATAHALDGPTRDWQ
jgi:NADH:ubiquinone oxidoreductase subunit F (NADH-binding)